MVEVDNDIGGCQLEHDAVDTEAVGRAQGYYLAGGEHLLVELAVDSHAFAGYAVDFVLGVGAEGFFGHSRQVEFVAGLFPGEFFVEGFDEADGHAVDYAVGVVGGHFVYEFFVALLVDAVELICYFEIFSGFDFHILFLVVLIVQSGVLSGVLRRR